MIRNTWHQCTITFSKNLFFSTIFTGSHILTSVVVNELLIVAAVINTIFAICTSDFIENTLYQNMQITLFHRKSRLQVIYLQDL